MTFVQAEFYIPTGGRTIDYIVVHDMEYPEKSSAAEDCANYFAHPRLADGTPNRASAHYCIDADSIVQCVRDQDVAYAAPRVNHDGIHLEHAGYAHQTRDQWLDGFSYEMLKRSARLTATKCVQYAIPAVYVDEAGLQRGERGITDHGTSTRAFGIVGGHTDPGPSFPMDEYIRLVRAELAPPTPKEWDEMATKEEIKEAMREVIAEELGATVNRVHVLRVHAVEAGATASKPPKRTMQKAIGALADDAGV